MNCLTRFAGPRGLALPLRSRVIPFAFPTYCFLASTTGAFFSWDVTLPDDLEVKGDAVVEGSLQVFGGLDLAGIKIGSVSDDEAWSSGEPPPLFTPLGRFSIHESIRILVSERGCGLGGSAEFYLAVSEPGHVQVYSLGDSGSGEPLVDRFHWFLQVIDEDAFYLAVKHVGGCAGAYDKAVTYTVLSRWMDLNDVNPVEAHYTALATRAYLEEEADPIFSSSAAASISANQRASWDMAYRWGNHAQVGYLVSESDPVFRDSGASGIQAADVFAWNDLLARSSDFLTEEMDGSISNELITTLELSGTVLTVIENENAEQSIDLNPIIPDSLDDADADPTNERISAIGLINGTEVQITEGGEVTGQFDLSPIFTHVTSLSVPGTGAAAIAIEEDGDVRVDGNLSVAGEITLSRQGDIYMGEFGIGDDAGPPP